jgi:hypothetical protein
MTLPNDEQLAIIRMASLIGRHRDALAPFEVELVEECVDRFRTKGAAMSLTANERVVLADALKAMDKAKAEAERAAGVPDHPLAFLRGQMTQAGWDTWIAPLKVETDDQGRATIIAPGALALCKVRQDWGLMIARSLGEVDWQVEVAS